MLNETHSHDVALCIYIQEGKMTFDVDGPNGFQTMTCRPGQTIEVPAEALHSESAGFEGVSETLLISHFRALIASV